jgi:hypothetical protein
MSLTTIESSIRKLEDLYYNIDLSIFECPDIKKFTIEYPKIINDIKQNLDLLKNSDKPSDIDFINVKQLDLLSN